MRTGIIAVIASTISARRLDQNACGPPAGGCSGPGLWDENKCRCLCIEKYCYDSFAGTCSTVNMNMQSSFSLYNHASYTNTSCQILLSNTFSMEMIVPTILLIAHRRKIALITQIAAQEHVHLGLSQMQAHMSFFGQRWNAV